MDKTFSKAIHLTRHLSQKERSLIGLIADGVQAGHKSQFIIRNGASVPIYTGCTATPLIKVGGCDRQHPMKIYDSLVLYGFRFTESQVRLIALFEKLSITGPWSTSWSCRRLMITESSANVTMNLDSQILCQLLVHKHKYPNGDKTHPWSEPVKQNNMASDRVSLKRVSCDLIFRKSTSHIQYSSKVSTRYF